MNEYCLFSFFIYLLFLDIEVKTRGQEQGGISSISFFMNNIQSIIFLQVLKNILIIWNTLLKKCETQHQVLIFFKNVSSSISH